MGFSPLSWIGKTKIPVQKWRRKSWSACRCLLGRHSKGLRLSTNTWRNLEWGLRSRVPGEKSELTWPEHKRLYSRAAEQRPLLHPVPAIHLELHAQHRFFQFLDSKRWYSHVRRQILKAVAGSLSVRRRAARIAPRKNRVLWSRGGSPAGIPAIAKDLRDLLCMFIGHEDPFLIVRSQADMRSR